VIITTTVDDVLLLDQHDNILEIKLVNPDVADILEQIKSDPVTAKLIAARSKGESVAERATADLEASIAKAKAVKARLEAALATNV
jgi:hypothetical protein